jgi:cation diffusion facilitator family transporter
VFKAATTSALLNAFLMSMQLAIGMTAHSEGLVADGIHTLSDLAADGVVLLVLFLGARGAQGRLRDADGDAAIQTGLASLFISLVLILTACEMLWNSVAANASLSGGVAIQIGALCVSGFVTLAKEGLFRYMRAAGLRTGSPVLLASAWHARMDAVSALVATLGLAGGLAGMPMLDHAAGAVIGLMILRMGYVTGRDALRQLLVVVEGTVAASQGAE